MKNLTIVGDLKKKGFRITKIRKSLLSILFSSNKPLSVGEIIISLLKKDISASKTTIYRELEFLGNEGIVRGIEFGDGKKRYEFDLNKHHHHIVCVSCGKIADIDFDVDLKKHEREISSKTGFKIKEHSIEFFGYCQKCQS